MNQNPDYTFGTASLEIILMVLAAFLSGMLLCWLLRKMGLCCNSSDHDYDDGYRYDEHKITGGGYTADINSLLRSREDAPSASHDISRPQAPDRPQGITREVSGATAAATGLAASIAGIGNGRKDDLKKLEGIGPKIEQVLNTAGIQNYDQLAAMSPDAIKPLLDAAGNQFKMHDPKSWPYQAELAAKGEWDRLQEYQNLLISGKE